jgi:hypothetical protein
MNKRVRVVGYLLIAVGVAHAVTGIAKYHQPLAAMLQEGFVDAVRPHLDRLLAFWFMLFTAILFLAGHITLHAAASRSTYLVRLTGWYLLIIGAIGALAIPKSPFWIAVVIAPVLLWSGYRLQPQAAD